VIAVSESTSRNGAIVLAHVARGRLEADYFTAFAEYRLREGLEPGVCCGLFVDMVGHRHSLLSFQGHLVGLGADALQVFVVKEIVGVGAEQVFRLVAE